MSCDCHRRLGPVTPKVDEAELQQIINDVKERWAAMSAPVLRMKMSVGSVKKVSDGQGNIVSEEVQLSAVYSSDPASANAQWSKWTPCASLNMQINNPDAFGRVLPGQFVFVDLTITDKDSL